MSKSLDFLKMSQRNYNTTGMITSSAYTSGYSEPLSDFESKVIQYHIETNTASLVRIGALKAKFGIGRQRESSLVSDIKSEKN